jgi:hypothetical protein
LSSGAEGEKYEENGGESREETGPFHRGHRIRKRRNRGRGGAFSPAAGKRPLLLSSQI